jgi:hypothetical protein
MPDGFIALAIGLWVLLGSAAQFVGAKTYLEGAGAILSALPIGLVMLVARTGLPLGDVFPSLLLFGYWPALCVIQCFSVRYRSLALAGLPFLLLLAGVAGWMVGDLRSLVLH